MNLYAEKKSVAFSAKPTETESVSNSPRSAEDELFQAALVHIQKKYAALSQPPPPDVMMFLAVLEDDPNGVRAALEAGADRQIKIGELVTRHAELLEDFHPYGVGEVLNVVPLQDDKWRLIYRSGQNDAVVATQALDYDPGVQVGDQVFVYRDSVPKLRIRKLGR